MRDLPGFLETRQTLLELKSNNKHNWISFALAHHLNGHHEVAAKVLESYEGGDSSGLAVFFLFSSGWCGRSAMKGSGLVDLWLAPHGSRPAASVGRG